MIDSLVSVSTEPWGHSHASEYADSLKDLWVSNVIPLSRECSRPGRITMRSPLISSFCQLERLMVMHQCQEFCPVMIILVDRKRKEVEMQEGKCRRRNAARSEGSTGTEVKVVLKGGMPSVTELQKLIA